MGILGELSDRYEAFTSSDSLSSSREFFKQHPGTVSMDSNQAGMTMTGRHDAAKHLASLALIPGAGKISFSIGKTLLGFSRPGSVLKVMWPLLLTDNPPGFLIRYIESRGGRDAKPGTTVPPVGPGRRPRPPVKPSRPGSPGQTSKPFWANGKPKCKKGLTLFRRNMNGLLE